MSKLMQALKFVISAAITIALLLVLVWLLQTFFGMIFVATAMPTT